MTKTILMVEDSATIRHLQCFVLKAQGFEVETAENGVEALEKLFANPDKFALLVADINMPKMDGLTLIRKLREQEAFINFPVIIVSSEQEEEDRKAGLLAGANMYMIKPIKPEVLAANVKMLLGEVK